MAKTKEKSKDEAKGKEEAQAKLDAKAQEAEGSSEENGDAEGTKTKLKEVKESGFDKKAILLKLLGVLVFAAVAGGAYVGLKGGITAEAPVEEEVSEQDQLGIDPSLSARELVQFGDGAVNEGDLPQATRFFESARLRADLEATSDINLTVDIYEGLAKIEDIKGNPKVAQILRDYILSKQTELGESLPIFNRAETLFREGKHLEARKEFARFLLTSESLGDKGERYIRAAGRRIADSWKTEYSQRHSQETSASLTNPEEFFRAER